MHLAARLRELEAEADAVRAELAEMDTLASQSEAAIYRLLSSVLASSSLAAGLPSDAELEAAMGHSSPQSRGPVNLDTRRQQIPSVRTDIEALSDRFMDRTIPQAVTCCCAKREDHSTSTNSTTVCWKAGSALPARIRRSASQSLSIATLDSEKSLPAHSTS